MRLKDEVLFNIKLKFLIFNLFVFILFGRLSLRLVLMVVLFLKVILFEERFLGLLLRLLIGVLIFFEFVLLCLLFMFILEEKDFFIFM